MSHIKVELKKEDVAKLKEICKSFNNKPGELINVLHQAQTHFGYLPAEVQEIIARELNIYGVASDCTQVPHKQAQQERE